MDLKYSSVMQVLQSLLGFADQKLVKNTYRYKIFTNVCPQVIRMVNDGKNIKFNVLDKIEKRIEWLC